MPEKEEEQERIMRIGIIPGSQRHYARRYGRWWDADKPWLGLIERGIFLLVTGIVVVLIALVLGALLSI